MKTNNKSGFFIAVLIILSHNCFGMDGQLGQPGGPGGYAAGVVQLPLDPSLVPAYQSQAMQQLQNATSTNFVLASIIQRDLTNNAAVGQATIDSLQPVYSAEHKLGSTIPTVCTDNGEESKALQKKYVRFASHTDSRGFVQDISSSYNNARFLCYSFGATPTNSIERITHNSTLFSVRAFNTYNEEYRENNTNSSIIRFDLFNDYKDGMSIENNNSASFIFSIGNTITWKNGFREDWLKDTNSSHRPINISKDMLKALVVAGIGLKMGVFKAGLTAVGIMAPSVFIVPIVCGGALLFPVVMMIGGSLLVTGFVVTMALGAAGIGVGTVLLPVIVPLYILKELLGK